MSFLKFGIAQETKVLHDPGLLVHGRDCPKAPHVSGKNGYLHDEKDNGIYDVDGVPYCGRCHYWMGCPVENILEK
jgi:hypothetical protein